MYKSIEEIRAQKEILNRAIEEKEMEIQDCWQALFAPANDSKIMTPTQKFLSYANIGAGVIDGAILGWKLYRKFNSGFFSSKKKRRR